MFQMIDASRLSSRFLPPRDSCSSLVGQSHLPSRPTQLTNQRFSNVVLQLSIKRLGEIKVGQKSKLESQKMVMWVFGYGSLIWKAGFPFDESVVCFIKGYRRVFHQGLSSCIHISPLPFCVCSIQLSIRQKTTSMICFGGSSVLGSTDHRGTPEYPGRTVTIEPAEGEVCWGVAYKISKKEDQEMAFTYLEVREKQYDKKAYFDVFTDLTATTPAISGVMVYIASPDKNLNTNYLGPASVEEIARQIIRAEGPSGPNRDYLFQLEKALLQIGCQDKHVMDLANEVRRILSEQK